MLCDKNDEFSKYSEHKKDIGGKNGLQERAQELIFELQDKYGKFTEFMSEEKTGFPNFTYNNNTKIWAKYIGKLLLFLAKIDNYIVFV